MKHLFRMVCCALLFHSILFPPVLADAADAVSEAAITLSGWGDKVHEKADGQKDPAVISEAKRLPQTGEASGNLLFFSGLLLVMSIAVFKRQRREKNEKQVF